MDALSDVGKARAHKALRERVQHAGHDIDQDNSNLADIQIPINLRQYRALQVPECPGGFRAGGSRSGGLAARTLCFFEAPPRMVLPLD